MTVVSNRFFLLLAVTTKKGGCSIIYLYFTVSYVFSETTRQEEKITCLSMWGLLKHIWTAVLNFLCIRDNSTYSISHLLNSGSKLRLQNQSGLLFCLNISTEAMYSGYFNPKPYLKDPVFNLWEIKIKICFPCRGSEIERETAWVIFDEVHYMQDRERGVVWEETIIFLPPETRMVFLSATLSNSNQFASWIAQLRHQPCHVVYTDYRPTPLQHYAFPQGGTGLHLVSLQWQISGQIHIPSTRI